jgi:hypothetical protein
MNHIENVSHNLSNLRMPRTAAAGNLCGYILQLPADFYGDIFAEEEAKKPNPVTSYRVVLKRYLKKTKKLAPRYAFVDSDGATTHIDVYLLHEYMEAGHLQGPYYVLLLPYNH